MKEQLILQQATGCCNFLFVPGKLTFLLDGLTAGSGGKGKLESGIMKLVTSDACQFLVTSNSANASHWVYDDGKEFMFKCLPSSAYMHEKFEKIYLCQGSLFEVSTLLKEIKMIGIPREKIRIHPKAGVIQPIDKHYEEGLCDLDGNYFKERGEGTLKGGTTASGSGSVRAKKCLRHKTLVFAGDIPELADMICETEKEIMERLDSGQSGLFQVGQGFPLSYGLANTKKNSTSRNVTVSAALDDAMIPPLYAGPSVLNGRTFPIKIHDKKYLSVPGHIFAEFDIDEKFQQKKYPEKLFDKVTTSHKIQFFTKKDVFLNGYDMKEYPDYPYTVVDSYSGDWYKNWSTGESDQHEIAWEDVEKQYGKEIPDAVKFTSLTLLLRKVATFSKMLLEDGIRYNRTMYPTYISINFMNWIDADMDGAKGYITPKAKEWLRENVYPILDKFPDVYLTFLGTGKESDEMVILEEPTQE